MERDTTVYIQHRVTGEVITLTLNRSEAEYLKRKVSQGLVARGSTRITITNKEDGDTLLDMNLADISPCIVIKR